MSRRTQRGPAMPGNQFAAIDVVCAPCQAAGLYRRIARFGRYPHPGADPEPWEEGWGKGGQRVRPEWTPAPGGSETVHLVCESSHHRPPAKRPAKVLLDPAAPGRQPKRYRMLRAAGLA